MDIKTKRALKGAAKVGAKGISGVISTVLKVIGTVILIGILTGAIFASIFVVYLKSNLTTDTDVTLEEFTVKQTSVIYCMNPDTGEYEEYCSLITSERRKWLDYKEIPIDFEHAVVAIEDKRFYTHHGVDWSRTASAFVHMFLSNSNTFGGSTLTQQLIKNVTLDDSATVQRKLSEIFRALELEKNYSKEEIIQWYLNLVYFGHGNYGIAAAADYYFGKTVNELSVAEIASIVGITNNPSLYSPYFNTDSNKDRQETILYEMFDQGYLSEAQYDAAVKEELVFVDHSHSSSSDSSSSGIYSWFTEALIDDAINDLMEQKNCSLTIASNLLYNGGYQIYSTINPKIQAIVDEVYTDSSNFTSGDREPLQSAIVITDPYTGDIVAMSGGVGEKTANLIRNRATDAKRPSGSSIKPLASYSPAMEYGYITPNTKIEDSEFVTLKGTSWMPKNDSLSYSDGLVTIRQAIIKSLNTVAAQLVDTLSPEVSYEFLTEKLHFTTLVPEGDMAYAPLALGQFTNGVTVREMAAGYSIFDNGGQYVETRTYSKICDADGNVVLEKIPSTNPAISPAVAYWMTDMMEDAARYGTGYESQFSGMSIAGKTGTTTSKCDRWFAGFTPYYVGIVWTGYDYPTKISWSGNPATQIWQKIMSRVHEGLEDKGFPVPADTYLKPVPGVEEVPYTVKGVCSDMFGVETVLYEETLESIDGREVTITAREVEGYKLEGNVELVYTVNAELENVIVFNYHWDYTANPFNPNDPYNPLNPHNPIDPNNPDDTNGPDDPNDPNDGGEGNEGVIDNIINYFTGNGG
ncbi:MAG: PBP1A family penicillin-binding protein [Oscillospiraceae bacterium]|nr:PBP1A family penicillin-binding protein [Oscillospiraceae bacterium]